MPEQEPVKFDKFSGKNDIKRAWELLPYELVTANNVDIDASGKMRRRSGYTRLLTGNFSSIFSNGSILVGLVDNDLVKVASNFTSTTMIDENIGTSTVSYADINDIIGYTNGSVIKYVQGGTVHAFPTPTEQFKSALAAGSLIEYYNGRFYIVIGSAFFWTDVLAQRFGCWDKRQNGRQLPSTIIMIKSVNDGLYLSDSNRIYFAKGEDPYSMTLDVVKDYPAIAGMAYDVDGGLLSQPTNETVLVIGTSKGLCLAMSGGNIINLTENFVDMPTASSGAILFKRGSINQIIASNGLTLHLPNFARTTYSNYSFNSFAYYNNKYLGASATGLYELTGSKDQTTNISSTIRTGLSDFGTSTKKNIPDVYLGLKNTGEMRVKSVMDDGVLGNAQDLAPSGDDIHTRRVKLSLGDRSRYWGVEITNHLGSDFELDSVELRANLGSRRL